MRDILPIYDNGAHLSDKDAKKLIERSASQEDAIETFFGDRPGQFYTPWEVYHAFNERWMITSIRRAMKQLTDQGILVKCHDLKKVGDGGVKCCTWAFLAGQTDLNI